MGEGAVGQVLLVFVCAGKEIRKAKPIAFSD